GIVVDGKHQLRGGGRLICWQINRDYQAFCAEVKGIYPGVKWRRHVVLVNGAVVVADALRSHEPHRYEQVWHFMGEFEPRTSLEENRALEGFDEGSYADLLEPVGFGGRPVQAKWRREGVKVNLWQSGRDADLVYTARTGICWNAVRGRPVDSIFTRREGRSARFVTVLEPHREGSRVDTVKLKAERNKTVLQLRWRDGVAKRLVFIEGAPGERAIRVR
ncbi:MAG: hypothetical protein KGZ25_04345, partial [Planctomycetes bacterium]|nr:hypothetical protein [Planctomycetota bacterium]